MIEKFFGNIVADSKQVSIPVLLRLAAGGAEVLGRTAGQVNASYWRQAQNVVNFTTVDLSSLIFMWVSGGWFERGLGVYRLDVPDEAFASGADWVEIAIQSTSCHVFHERYNLEKAVQEIASTGILESGISNTYISLISATDYFNTRLNSRSWDTASATDQTKALQQATRIIDRLNFSGTKTDDTQQLEFPRNGDITVPSDILIACCEIAINLLDGVDPDTESENLYSQSNGYSSARNQSVNWGVPIHTRNGVPSATAWNYLRPYLIDIRNLRIHRVS